MGLTFQIEEMEGISQQGRPIPVSPCFLVGFTVSSDPASGYCLVGKIPPPPGGGDLLERGGGGGRGSRGESPPPCRNIPNPQGNRKSPRRGLLDQAQVRTPFTPPFWGSFAYDTPMYGTGCPTPCKIIILGEKMIPQ